MEDRQPVLAGKAPIEHDQVPRAGFECIPCSFPVDSVLDGEAVFAQPAHNKVREIRLVFDDQDAYRHPLALA